MHSTTADSLDLLLQPRLVVDGDPYGLFTADEGKKPAKDEEKKVSHLPFLPPPPPPPPPRAPPAPPSHDNEDARG